MNYNLDTSFDLQSGITSIMGAMSGLSTNSANLGGLDLGGAANMTIAGLRGNSSLELLFSSKLDKFIDTLLDLFILGDIETVSTKLTEMISALANGGVGSGLFKTEISQRILKTVDGSVNSIRYRRTKSKIRKALYVVNNLKKQGKKIKNKEERAKYERALKSLISLITFIKKVYDNRKYVSDKVMTGLQYLVVEEVANEGVMKITC